jgi:SAM-dependent methyltransferase
VWESPVKQLLSEREAGYIRTVATQYKPHTVLDIGCGTGRILDIYRSIPFATDVYGLDISDVMVSHCITRFEHEDRIKKIMRGEITDTSIFSEIQFDMISAIRVLKYNENWEEILRRIHTLLRPGGILVSTMPNIHSITGVRPDTFSSKHVPMQYTTPRKFSRALLHAGFQVLDMRGFSKLPEVLYTHTTTTTGATFLQAAEKVLENILGPVVATRILFSTSRKDV